MSSISRAELGRKVLAHITWLITGQGERLDLSGHILVEEDLSGLNLLSANLKNSLMTGCDFTGSVLCYADLRNADFKGTNLTDADLRRAKLGGIDLHGATLIRTKF